jgi:hypothetical protein
MSSQTIIACPKCNQQVDTDSRFCKHCAYDLSSSPQASSSAVDGRSRKKQLFIILGILGGLGLVAVLAFGGLVWYVRHKTNDDRVVFESDSSTTTSNSSSSSETYTGELTNEVAKRTVQRWYKKGSVDVVGVQELPQQNSAVAQLKFTDLYYKADGRDNLTYSGPAEAVFVHYNDGRWVLSKITIGRGFNAVIFNNVGIEAR